MSTASLTGNRILLAGLLLIALAATLTGLLSVSPPPPPGAAVSLAARPTWPYAWAQAAVADGVSPARAEALRAEAAALGPSERNLRTSLAVQALRLWPQLSASAQRQAEADIVFALRTQAQTVLNTAFTLRREEQVCPLWQEGGDIAQVCANMRGLRRICDHPKANAELQRWCFARGALPVGRDG